MNILIVVHNYVGLGKVFGGVELTVREILEATSTDSTNTNRYYVLSYEHRRKSPHNNWYVLMDMSKRTDDGTLGLEIFQFEGASPFSFERYHDERFAAEFRDIIQRYSIDIVHFHHLLYFPLNTPIIAQQAGALTVLSLHDYYTVCHEMHLLKNYKTFCGFPEEVTLDTCDVCLRETFGYGYGTQKFRRQLIAEIFSLADAVQYQSDDERRRFWTAYPLLADKESLVIGSPLVLKVLSGSDGLTPLPVFQAVRNPKQYRSDSSSDASNPPPSLPVICLGNFSGEKGGDALVDLFHRCTDSTERGRFQFHLYGDVRSPFDKKLEALSKSGTVILHGKYDSRCLLEELNGCNGIALFGSNWPETWVRTLSESTACGLVPVAPRIGAFIERISDGINGILYEPSSVDSMLRALKSIAANPAKLQRMQQGLLSIACPTIDDNIQAFNALYAKVYETGTQPEYARHRANRAAGILSSSRPAFWNSEFRPGAESTTPVMAHTGAGVGTTLRRKSLWKRAWGVFRSRGLVYTVWAAFNYKKLRRTR